MQNNVISKFYLRSSTWQLRDIFVATWPGETNLRRRLRKSSTTSSSATLRLRRSASSLLSRTARRQIRSCVVLSIYNCIDTASSRAALLRRSTSTSTRPLRTPPSTFVPSPKVRATITASTSSSSPTSTSLRRICVPRTKRRTRFLVASRTSRRTHYAVKSLLLAWFARRRTSPRTASFSTGIVMNLFPALALFQCPPLPPSTSR